MMRIVWIFLCLTACNAMRTLPPAPQVHFAISAKIDTPCLYLDTATPQTALTLTIAPKTPMAHKAHYHLRDWNLPEGLQGKLYDQHGTALQGDDKLCLGENKLFYKPLSPGQHTLRLLVVDQYGDQAQELLLDPIDACQQTPRHFTLTLQPLAPQYYVFRTAELSLHVTTAQDSGTLILEHVSAPPGKLALAQSGEPLVPGTPLSSGQHALTFAYAGPRHCQPIPIPISLRLRDEAGDVRTVTTQCTLLPVNFCIEAQEHPAKAAADALSTLSIALTGADEALHAEQWCLTDWHWSAGFVGTLLNTSGQAATRIPLTCPQATHGALQCPTLVVGKPPRLFVRVQGPGETIRTGTATLHHAQQASLRRAIAHLQATAKAAQQCANKYLHQSVRYRTRKELLATIDALSAHVYKLEATLTTIEQGCVLDEAHCPPATRKALAALQHTHKALRDTQKTLEEEKATWRLVLAYHGGKDINVCDSDGRIALHAFAGLGRFTDKVKRLFRFVIDRTHDVDQRDDSGYTALHTAVLTDNKEAIRILLDAGVSKNSKNNDGLTPLLIAVRQDQDAITEFLIQKGANVNTATNEGQTPLMIIAQKGKYGLAKQLIAAGADCLAQMSGGGGSKYHYDTGGWNAVHSAVEVRDRTMVYLLLEEIGRIGKHNAHLKQEARIMMKEKKWQKVNASTYALALYRQSKDKFFLNLYHDMSRTN